MTSAVPAARRSRRRSPGRSRSRCSPASAAITDGRIRQLSLPHSLEAINGQIAFDAGGMRIDGLRARLASGDVTFSGRVGLNGFSPGEST